jgi:hypothetical protein
MIIETIQDVELKRMGRTGMFDFFITGFPFSGMAWIANYLSYDKMLCHYGEPSPDLARCAGIVGVSGSGLLLMQDRLIKENPNAKWILIDRSHSDARQAFRDHNLPVDQTLTDMGYKIGELRLKTKVYIAPFDALHSLISDIARHIDPGWTCPKSRHDMLVKMNIEVAPPVSHKAKPAEAPRPTKTQLAYYEVLREICNSNNNAYRWLCQAIPSASIVDHVVDGDLIDFKVFDHVVKGVLLEWGLNDFFLKNSRYLIPVMSAAMSAWQFSVGDMKRVKHYDIYSELPCAVGFILGGQQLVDRFSPKLRQLVAQLMDEDNRRDT